MESITQIVVSLPLGNKPIEVGELVASEGKIYFKYYSDFLNLGINISPFKLPLSSEIISVETAVFDGLHGVFNDSLPDSWGKLLLDKHLFSKGISLNEISALDRLMHLDGLSKGALTYSPKIESKIKLSNSLDLEKIAEESRKMMEGDSEEFLENLRQIGGSSGGARPKIFVGYNPKKNNLLFGEEKLPEGYAHWIIKFPATDDFRDIANVEYAYYKMALDAGIEMTESRLFTDKKENQYFGTKRFDRIGNERIHTISASGLLHDNYRFSNLDYGNIMDAAFRLENHVIAYEKVLRLSVFNVLAHNKDDHSKNFSFLMDKDGNWRFSPAYDLTFSYSSHKMQSTTVAGEGKRPTKKQFEELASIFGVKNFPEIYNQVNEVIKNWQKYANECGVSQATTKLIGRELKNL